MLICCVSSPKSYFVEIVHLNVLKRKFSKNNDLHLDFTTNNIHADSNSNLKVRICIFNLPLLQSLTRNEYEQTVNVTSHLQASVSCILISFLVI